MERIFDETLIHKDIQKYSLSRRFDAEMLALAQLHAFKKGETILNAGTQAEYFYLLTEGRVKVSYPFENGKSMVMKFYSGFITLGDIELIQNIPVCCNVEAVSAVRVLAFPMDLLRLNYMSNVKLLQHLSDILSIKLQATINNTSYNSVYPLTNRVASYLIGRMKSGGEIKLNASYTEIAEFLDTTYRHLSRTLSELESEGIIRTEGKVIWAVDEEALRELSKNPYQQSL